MANVIGKLVRCTCCTLLCLQGVAASSAEEPEPANDPLALGADTLEQALAETSAAGELVEVDRARLVSQTKLLAGLCVVTALGLYSLPSSITGWDRDAKISNLPDRWWNNVSRKPIWDTDHFFFNYIGHPYVGGVYYQMARKSGYSQGVSLLYTTLMSTFLWEYGVEAFAERPSIQDLFITPLAGWVLGEWAFRTEKKIEANQGRVLGSKILGEISLVLMDPMSRIANGINRLVGGEWILTGTLAPQPALARYASRSNHPEDFGLRFPMPTLTLQLRF